MTNTKKNRPALIKSAEVFMTRKEASAILSGIVMALSATGGRGAGYCGRSFGKHC